MPRKLSANLITSLTGRKQIVADLIEIHLATAVYLTNSFIDLSYDSDTAPDSGANNYTAQGQFLALGNVDESRDLRVSSMTLAFTAVDFTTLAYVLNNEYIDRRVVLYRAVLDDNYAIDSDKVFQYFDGTNVITVPGSSVSRAITAYEYEERENDKRREIYLLKRSYIPTFIKEFKKANNYKKSSDFINSRLKKTGV